MANVKYHRCFPTTIGQFGYYPDDTDKKNMVEYVVKSKKNLKIQKVKAIGTMANRPAMRCLFIC